MNMWRQIHMRTLCDNKGSEWLECCTWQPRKAIVARKPLGARRCKKAFPNRFQKDYGPTDKGVSLLASRSVRQTISSVYTDHIGAFVPTPHSQRQAKGSAVAICNHWYSRWEMISERQHWMAVHPPPNAANSHESACQTLELPSKYGT